MSEQQIPEHRQMRQEIESLHTEAQAYTEEIERLREERDAARKDAARSNVREDKKDAEIDALREALEGVAEELDAKADTESSEIQTGWSGIETARCKAWREAADLVRAALDPERGYEFPTIEESNKLDEPHD
jgi:predicted  nucleic acid-binding Zn-ribbon protein